MASRRGAPAVRGRRWASAPARCSMECRVGEEASGMGWGPGAARGGGEEASGMGRGSDASRAMPAAPPRHRRKRARADRERESEEAAPLASACRRTSCQTPGRLSPDLGRVAPRQIRRALPDGDLMRRARGVVRSSLLRCQSELERTPGHQIWRMGHCRVHREFGTLTLYASPPPLDGREAPWIVRGKTWHPRRRRRTSRSAVDWGPRRRARRCLTADAGSDPRAIGSSLGAAGSDHGALPSPSSRVGETPRRDGAVPLVRGGEGRNGRGGSNDFESVRERAGCFTAYRS
jgi:hypothetical protein